MIGSVGFSISLSSDYGWIPYTSSGTLVDFCPLGSRAFSSPEDEDEMFCNFGSIRPKVGHFTVKIVEIPSTVYKQINFLRLEHIYNKVEI